MNDVVTLMTAIGEVVGRISSTTETDYIVDNPRLFAQMDGSAGFVPGVSMTGAKNPEQVTFSKSQVIFMVETDPQVAAQYLESVTGIALSGLAL